jgi:hypothetical protein
MIGAGKNAWPGMAAGHPRKIKATIPSSHPARRLFAL